ncbi:putative lipase [Xylariaceae sp. FL1272]|nr:putative lipase [Xylariaceae sp. FL1272]
MQLSKLLPPVSLLVSYACAIPSVFDRENNITYNGIERNGIEVFLGIPYGKDTSGEHRFKPPRPYEPEPGATINAQSYGFACPQSVGVVRAPLSLANVTVVSEDCLNLDVTRPPGLCSSTSRLPVMVWIYGGSFIVGSTDEPTNRPDGMILESIRNGLPVIHVALNYRLGVFGFAQSESLKADKSENAGLRDQRLALEWVRDNIAAFGGDPDRITVYGQSSGGLAVTSQVLAYGGTKPVPFQQGACESQSLATLITDGHLATAMQAIIDEVGCTADDDAKAIACLRSLDMETLFEGSTATFPGEWFPSVDGDFWPAAPSELLRDGRFANVNMMIGWTEDDLTLYTPATIQTAQDTYDFVRASYPGISAENLDKLLALYKTDDFAADAQSNHSSEFYRSSRISRDIVMVCQSLLVGHALAQAGNNVFHYDWNQTIVGPALASVRGLYGVGVPHTAEFAYVFGNLSAYDVNGYPFEPTEKDYALAIRGSRSWSTFACTGSPSLDSHDTFIGFERAYRTGDGDPYIFVVGGPREGLSAVDGPLATEEIEAQKIRERCALLNSPELIEQLAY